MGLVMGVFPTFLQSLSSLDEVTGCELWQSSSHLRADTVTKLPFSPSQVASSDSRVSSASVHPSTHPPIHHSSCPPFTVVAQSQFELCSASRPQSNSFTSSAHWCSFQPNVVPPSEQISKFPHQTGLADRPSPPSSFVRLQFLNQSMSSDRSDSDSLSLGSPVDTKPLIDHSIRPQKENEL